MGVSRRCRSARAEPDPLPLSQRLDKPIPASQAQETWPCFKGSMTFQPWIQRGTRTSITAFFPPSMYPCPFSHGYRVPRFDVCWNSKKSAARTAPARVRKKHLRSCPKSWRIPTQNPAGQPPVRASVQLGYLLHNSLPVEPGERQPRPPQLAKERNQIPPPSQNAGGRVCRPQCQSHFGRATALTPMTLALYT